MQIFAASVSPATETFLHAGYISAYPRTFQPHFMGSVDSATTLDLASALGFAHKQRIVHRDMKPANVLHAGEDRWKLADFGIARLPDSDLTQVGIFMGTPGYSPPEAISEGRYTPQADVFAWGAVVYELLCGYIPYEGPDTRTTNGYVLAAA